MRNESRSETRTHSSTTDASSVSGQHSLPMPSTRYGPSGCSSSAVKTEPFGIDRDDQGRRAVLLEVPPDARDRSAGADRDDHGVDVAAVGLLPELGAGRLVVGLGVRRIRVLVGLESAGDLLGEPVGDRVVALRRVRVDRGRRDDDLGAVRAQHGDLLLAHLVRHHEDAAVPAQRGGDREADARVARGRLDDRPARAQPPVLLRRLDHRMPDPVLHRAAGVQVLELREQLAGDVAGEPLEAHDRRVPDELQHGGVLAARHRRTPSLDVPDSRTAPVAFRPRDGLRRSRSTRSRARARPRVAGRPRNGRARGPAPVGRRARGARGGDARLPGARRRPPHAPRRYATRAPRSRS